MSISKLLTKATALIALGCLLAVQSVSAADFAPQPEPPKQQKGEVKTNIAASPFSGKITEIKGNIITIMNDLGKTKIVEVTSAQGLKMGDRVKCEGEGAGVRLKAGSIYIPVQRVVQ